MTNDNALELLNAAAALLAFLEEDNLEDYSQERQDATKRLQLAAAGALLPDPAPKRPPLYLVTMKYGNAHLGTRKTRCYVSAESPEQACAFARAAVLEATGRSASAYTAKAARVNLDAFFPSFPLA
jgi:hypothetical protein